VINFHLKKKEILFLSISLLTPEAIESIFKENIEVMKIEARDTKLQSILEEKTSRVQLLQK
jgi:hypothetical protein